MKSYQTEVEQFARRLFASRPKTFDRLAGAYANAGIDKRHPAFRWNGMSNRMEGPNETFVESARPIDRRSAASHRKRGTGNH